jgi:hypothetical protein
MAFMTEQEQKIFYRLLVDLFVDNPKRKQNEKQGKGENNEDISTQESTRRPKRQSPTATH